MADWGLLGALRGRDDWQAIRADKQRDLQYQQVLNQMQADENASNEQKQAAIQSYLQTANNLQVLQPDMERIQSINDPLVQGIAENIKKYNGDLDKYWKVQGQVDMQQYLNQLMHHPTTVKALMNASNASRWQADQQAGLQELTDIDPVTGEPINGFDSQMQDFLAGDIDQLSYKGAYKPAKTDETIFGKLYGSENRYKSVPVAVGDYRDTKYRELLDAGLSEAHAKHQAALMAQSYKRHLDANGTPLRYKSDKWSPPSGWGTENDADEALKYTVEGVAGAMKPAKDNPEFGWQKHELQDVSQADKAQKSVNSTFGFSLGKPTLFYTSDRLAGTPLGKGSIPVFEMNSDKTGIAKDASGNPIVLNQQQIDNAFEGFGQDEEGNVFYHTTVSDKLSNLGQGQQWIPFTDSSIDQLVLSAPATSRAKLSAALRKVLKEKGAYPKNEAPMFSGSKKEAAEGYVIGQVVNGYKYKGGDPTDESNWEEE